MISESELESAAMRRSLAKTRLELFVQVVMGSMGVVTIIYWVLEKRSEIGRVLVVPGLSSSFFHSRNNCRGFDGCGNSLSGG